MKQYLYNTKIRNSYNQKHIYRLTVKLNPTQWNKVREHFKFYNFKELKGWGTTHPYDVISTLLEDENKEYQQLTEQITQAQKDCANANSYLETEEYTGLITNLKYQQSKLINKHIPRT